MLAAATSLFARTNISQSYIIAPHAPFHVGPWKVSAAAHKTTSKSVSVWSFDKRAQDFDRSPATARERVLEILNAEASALRRLRHPSILEMVEPLEETRSELTFATEPLLSSLAQSIPGATPSPLVDLDEVEIQKGILQLCKGLTFLHTSARLIHSNLAPQNILINANGDWKISGLGLTIPLAAPDGSPTPWHFPTYDSRLSPHVQRSLDYMAPEYALDEQLTTASDMYSLGCLIYAVHAKGSPPFKTHGILTTLRDNAGAPLPRTERLDPDLKTLLTALITRHAQPRPGPATLPSYAFFSSLPVSTLNFLDRSIFASKSREEKIAFMKGLTTVLPRFSDGLRTRKILPSLIEEMKDTHLLPSILPNVFVIAQTLAPPQFASTVLPSLRPLFAVKEPPQNMLTLLDNLALLQDKTDKATFKEHVLPLVYNALESEHAVVQERALTTVPALCESIDYAEVESVLFRRVALVFTQTRILSVKVATLACFLEMVKTLDQTSLTQKLVPLLSKIRTREPAVMLGTLAVQEAMGMKVDREAVATLVLPQLWAMSMGPLINVDQFQRFMSVIRALGTRVEKEHTQYLKDAQRIEDRSAGAHALANGLGAGGAGGTVDFASLVSGASAGAGGASKGTGESDGWDDVWGSIMDDAPAPAMQQQQSYSLPASPAPFAVAASVPSGAATHTASALRPSLRALGAAPKPAPPFAPFPAPPRHNSGSSGGGSVSGLPLAAQLGLSAPPPLKPPAPNYNISLAAPTPTAPGFMPPPLQQQQPNYNISLAQPAPAPFAAVLAPSAPAKPAWGAPAQKQQQQQQQQGRDAWGDFDPLA